MSPRRIRPSGFTLIELLVAMAIIGVLVALLMPAVQMARASARRVSCQNQLRQLSLGLITYHDSHGCFPPGSFVMGMSHPMQSGWGWGAMILPAVDQGPLYQRIDFGQGTAVAGNLALIATPIPFWRCPADVGLERIVISPLTRPPFDLASGNYCGSAGILSSMSNVRISEISDGTSLTFLLGERLVQTASPVSLAWTSAWCGSIAFQDGYELGSVPYLRPFRIHPINHSDIDSACFGSRHAGGANFVMADGSARFLNENMDWQVYEALGTPNGGEVVELP